MFAAIVSDLCRPLSEQVKKAGLQRPDFCELGSCFIVPVVLCLRSLSCVTDTVRGKRSRTESRSIGFCVSPDHFNRVRHTM